MKLLKNKAAFNRWKKKHIHGGDTANCPEEFPCYVYTVVQSFGYEEEEACYLYADDIDKMRQSLDLAKEAQ